ncbi:MAG TPA: metallophosphoesterase [Blastocatellia bacterium]|nr:metallophosphoesterase [Blastocatellia bacterium]
MTRKRKPDDSPQAELPPGIKLLHRLEGHKNTITQVAWSPDGKTLASVSSDKTIMLWDAQSGKAVRVLDEHSGGVYCVAWSPDGKMVASGSGDRTIRLWDAESGKVNRIVKGHSSLVFDVAWSPDGRTLASGAWDNTVRLWDAESGELIRILEGHSDKVNSMIWSRNGKMLASGSIDQTIRFWDVESGKKIRTLQGFNDSIFSIAWSVDGKTLASSSDDLRVWNPKTGDLIRILEGHSGPIVSTSFSADGLLLASKCDDDTIRIWRCDTWETVAIIPEVASGGPYPLRLLAFHNHLPILATPGERDMVIHIYHLDVAALLGAAPAESIVQYTSAKIVLLGESNVGKSCLAMRLADDRYPNDDEHGTTHGMRFWEMKPEQLGPAAVAPRGQRRDIVLWDMGGQDEYRLVHQLFLHDTTLALIPLDPTRGRTAFEEVEGWSKRLDKQLGSRRAVKLLVGTKMDEPSDLVDYAGLKQLTKDCGFAGYYETSAKTGRGIEELRQAIADALDWEKLAKTSRPELFQRIRDEIDRRRENGEIVLLLSDLEESIREENPDDYSAAAVAAVAEQLATQGVIANTRLASGERTLVLQISEIERYAGSLIVAARNNARKVPALEESRIASPDVPLPGIKEKERLPRLQERIVLECVAQLLVEHGVCFKHEGLLVFPSLFRPTEKEGEEVSSTSVSLYYDFSGAVDNIYASLVAWLVMGKDFGRVRLWDDRAEFETSAKGVCGVRKVDRGRGFAHLDVYFKDHTAQSTRELFISFVEDHLRRHDIDITEHIEMSCPSCGYQFSEGDIRERISLGEVDAGCIRCDRRVEIATGAAKARYRDPSLDRRTIALRTKVEENVKKAARAVKQVFKQKDEDFLTDEPIRILHLSDLHFDEAADVKEKLRPLIADIKDRDGGLGFDRLDYLVVSGDITNRATPREFENAQQFMSGLIAGFQLSAQRCILVPGNHDLSWDEKVYNWVQKRLVNKSALKEGRYREAGDGYLIRDEDRYPDRFKNYSKNFYHPLVQQEYPLHFEDQGIPYLFTETGIQFITFNSACEIDEWFPDRASIHPGALARALEKAEEQVAEQMKKGASVFRIAVWHHPITGNEKIVKDAFLQQLRQANVLLALHGHVHEDRPDVVGYPHPKKIHVAGAGSFGAPTNDRPESTPRLYNLIEIARDHSSVMIHTRCLRKEEGAWEGWAVWPGAEPTDKRTYYTVNLTS